ncbi:MAG: protein kinase, partial [Candidatus Eisenbacteria bacterium]|nr:protein kinase [Candidatus Eisenbacteria bacterium]
MAKRPLDEIINDALGHAPSERPDFLARTCGGDEALRREAEDLLSLHAKWPGLLDLPATVESGRPSAIGSYRIRREVARGGMGVVYEAEDPKLQRRIALKLLPERLAQSLRWREQFQREARLLAALNHPNIATVHSLEEAGGLHFITMELLTGRMLADVLHDGSPPLADSLRILRQVAKALEAVHGRDIVHCDLKPQNIAVGDDGHVKVLDFGLARRHAADQRAGETARRASGGAALITGTPGYMSPEQIHGAAVDARADIWAAGCILYECLTGHPPFSGDTPQETIAATLQQEPDWSLLPENVTASLGALVRHCLSKDPEARPPTIAAVRRIIDDEVESLIAPDRAAPAEDLPPSNLRYPLDAFVGRAAEMSRIQAALKDNRLVTLTGSGGCGKTRLALEAAHNRR